MQLVLRLPAYQVPGNARLAGEQMPPRQINDQPQSYQIGQTFANFAYEGNGEKRGDDASQTCQSAPIPQNRGGNVRRAAADAPILAANDSKAFADGGP